MRSEDVVVSCTVGDHRGGAGGEAADILDVRTLFRRQRDRCGRARLVNRQQSLGRVGDRHDHGQLVNVPDSSGSYRHRRQ